VSIGALAHLKAVCSSTIVALALWLGVVDNCVPDCCQHQLVSHKSSRLEYSAVVRDPVRAISNWRFSVSDSNVV
jgi:hypothetical protein